jgi:hypothetical protein
VLIVKKKYCAGFDFLTGIFDKKTLPCVSLYLVLHSFLASWGESKKMGMVGYIEYIQLVFFFS